jgi:hypothetical protein
MVPATRIRDTYAGYGTCAREAEWLAGRGAGAGQRSGSDDHRVGQVTGDHPAEGHAQADGQQQPADGMAGPAAGQHHADGAGRQRRQRRWDHERLEQGQVGPSGVADQYSCLP